MKLSFSRKNGAVDEAIDRLLEQAGGIQRPEIVREMILASLKAGQEDDEQADLKLMNSTLKEMRFTAKVFGPYRRSRKVTVFGSARTSRDRLCLWRGFSGKTGRSGIYGHHRGRAGNHGRP